MRFRSEDRCSGQLTWDHTEFGRRSTCEQYRIVRTGAGWHLLDADWDPLAPPVATIRAAQRQAERWAARAAAAHDASSGGAHAA
jgi:hypothetical protein